MKTSYHFSCGTQFRWKDSLYSVHRNIDPQNLIIKNTETEQLLECPVMSLVQALSKGELIFDEEPCSNRRKVSSSISNPEDFCIDLSDFPEKYVEILKFRIRVITPLLENEYEKNRAESFLKQVKLYSLSENNPEGHKISIRSIYKWIKDYESSGRDYRALLPNFAQCGGRGKSRLDIELQNLINATIKEYYLQREHFTIDDIVAIVASKIKQENQFRSEFEKLTFPSRTAIFARIQDLDLHDRLVARNGKRKAKMLFTQVGKIKYPEIPLARVEIDHTVTDLIVIDEKDSLPLGRLTLTLMIDTATRYPLGYYLGFENPSYLTIQECLFNAILPKSDVKKQYGTEHDWIAYGIPNTLVTDQGKDFRGTSLENACLDLGIVLERAPRKSPEYKATVERIFGTLNTGVFHKIPGTTLSNIIKRGDYNSEKSACLSLEELEKAINIFIVDIYAEKKHRGLDAIPARKWEHSLSNNFYPRLPKDSRTLEVLLGRIEHKVINRDGIFLWRLRYNCPELSVLRLQMNRKKVKIKFHPGDLSKIFVFNPFENKYIEVPSLDPEITNELSLWKYNVLRHYLLKNGDKVNMANIGRAIEEIQDIINLASDRSKTHKRAKIARYKYGGKKDKKTINPDQTDKFPTSGLSVPNLTQITQRQALELIEIESIPILNTIEEWEIVDDPIHY